MRASPGTTALLALLLLTLTVPLPARTGEKTVFADEFSGRELDRSHWNVIVTGRSGLP